MNLATYLIFDALDNDYEVAVFVSNDSDLARAGSEIEHLNDGTPADLSLALGPDAAAAPGSRCILPLLPLPHKRENTLSRRSLMAQIVLGIGSTHGSPSTSNPAGWRQGGEFDRRRPDLWFRGKPYTYPELVEERASEHLQRELDEEKQNARSLACQAAIASLAETLAEVAPDRCIILGDDQHESFLDDIMPAFCVFNGETVDDPGGDEQGDPLRRALVNAPAAGTSQPTDAGFGTHIIESLVSDGFDVARSSVLPKGRRQGGIGHAFYFAYRRLMNNGAIPHVPIFVNTYYPPNAPTMKRCYQFGKALRSAVETWERDQRVAIIASGGMSHFVIEEDLDLQVLDGLREGGEKQLTAIPDNRFRSGTSEIRNWIALAGAMEETGLRMELLAYEPCYRSEAGTGCGGAYAHWR